MLTNTHRKRLMTALMATCLLATASSCKKSEADAPQPTEKPSIYARTSSTAIVNNCSSPYKITLESIIANSNGTFTWTWSVKNPNPGNGKNGTVQDLSHWDIVLNGCSGPSGLKPADIVSAATKSGCGWQSFCPTVAQDPSIANTCNINTGPVLKFPAGTSGSAKTYYRLTVSRDFTVNMNGQAYYKSGSRTKCGTTCFPGIGCEENLDAGA
jgi:hypothetical protein